MNVRRSVAAIAAALVLLGTVALASPATATVSPESIIYSVPAPPAGISLRAPVITAYDADNLVVAWRNQDDTVQDDAGDVYAKWSDDGGETWSSEILLKASDATWSYVNVLLYKDPSSNNMYAYIGRVATGDNPNLMKLIGMRSTDKGHTWTDISLTNSLTTPTITGGNIVKVGSSYLMPYYTTSAHGVLQSTDLTTWSQRSVIASAPLGVTLQEGFIAPANDGSGDILMVMRVGRGSTPGPYAYTTRSTDDGFTWSTPAADPNIPSTGAKGFFATSSLGAYVAVTGNNTLGTRTALTYQVAWPHQAWSPKRFFADAPANPALGGYTPGWDTYPHGVEVSPGRYMVVWEHGTAQVKIAELNINDDPYGVVADWASLDGWTITGTTVEVSPASQLRLANNNGSPASAVFSHGPVAGAYRVEYRAKVDTYTANSPTSGVSLGTKVATGTRRLMVAHQADGVYAITQSSSPAWVKVWSNTGDASFHTWRIDVDTSGSATLFRDGAGPLATWATQTSSATPVVQHWSTGTAGQPSEAHVDWTNVNTTLIDTPWDSTSGWSKPRDQDLAGISPAGNLELDDSGAFRASGPRLPFTAEFRATVSDYTAAAPTSGVSLGFKVDTGQKRLMLAVQTDGVWAITAASAPNWTRVYTATGDTSAHTWRVEVDANGAAELFKDGTSTSATWALEPSTRSAIVGFWSAGASGDSALARVDWTLIR